MAVVAVRRHAPWNPGNRTLVLSERHVLVVSTFRGCVPQGVREDEWRGGWEWRVRTLNCFH